MNARATIFFLALAMLVGCSDKPTPLEVLVRDCGPQLRGLCGFIYQALNVEFDPEQVKKTRPEVEILLRECGEENTDEVFASTSQVGQTEIAVKMHRLAPVTDGVYSSALVTDDSVYFGDTAGIMYCLERETGKEKWQVNSKAAQFPNAHSANLVMASPILADGKVVFGGGAYEHPQPLDKNYACCSGRGFVVALDPAPGEVIWKYDVGPKPEKFDPPVVIEDEYGRHAFSSNKLLCINAQNGELLKEFSIGPVLCGPSVSRGRVYVGTGNTQFSNSPGEAYFPKKYTGELLVFGLPDSDE